MNPVTLDSIITRPERRHKKEEIIAEDSCQYY
jgi:hypothetical protein